VFGFAGVVLYGLELTSLAGTVDYHVHVGRNRAFGFFNLDGESGLRHFISPLSYEVLHLVSLKRRYEIFKKMSRTFLRFF
jgi:hypothetical protein